MLADIEAFGPDRRRASTRPTATSTSTSYFGGAIAVYNTDRRTRRHRSSSANTRRNPRVAVDSQRQRLRRQRRRPRRNAKGTTEVYSHSRRTDLGQLDGEPLLRRRGRPDRRPRLRRRRQPGVRVRHRPAIRSGSRPAIGVVSRARSASPPIDGTHRVSATRARRTSPTFGPLGLPADPQTDNPLVIDSVSSAGQPPDRRLPGHPVGRLRGLHLDPAADRLRQRPSIARSSATTRRRRARLRLLQPDRRAGDRRGRAGRQRPRLTDDGRVFFNSTEGLVDRDLNESEDAYEWEPTGTTSAAAQAPCRTNIGCVELISTGTSPFASSLLGISADGTDAYFFTRDTLVEETTTATRSRSTTPARGGGFPFVPPRTAVQGLRRVPRGRHAERRRRRTSRASRRLRAAT